jgi:hypothetical protein
MAHHVVHKEALEEPPLTQGFPHQRGQCQIDSGQRGCAPTDVRNSKC